MWLGGSRPEGGTGGGIMIGDVGSRTENNRSAHSVATSLRIAVSFFEHQGGAVSTWDDAAQTTALSWPTEFHPAWTDQFRLLGRAP